MASRLLTKSPYKELLTVCALVLVVLCCALAGVMHVDQRQRQHKCDPCLKEKQLVCTPTTKKTRHTNQISCFFIRWRASACAVLSSNKRRQHGAAFQSYLFTKKMLGLTLARITPCCLVRILENHTLRRRLYFLKPTVDFERVCARACVILEVLITK